MSWVTNAYVMLTWWKIAILWPRTGNKLTH